MSFIEAYNITMGHEGVYDNNPLDRGGETYKGIARKFHPNWEGWAEVDKIKGKETSRAKISKLLNAQADLDVQVQGFYKREFWDKLMLDNIGENEVTTELFEQAVNQGVATASRHLQHALNLLNRSGKDWLDIDEDGKVGKKTIKAYDAYMATASKLKRDKGRLVKTLVKVLNALQFDRYRDICDRATSQEVFLYGWMNRV
ncbi:MAG: glycoside hydrolase family 108 protein [Bacteroidales bacterium]